MQRGGQRHARRRDSRETVSAETSKRPAQLGHRPRPSLARASVPEHAVHIIRSNMVEATSDASVQRIVLPEVDVAVPRRPRTVHGSDRRGGPGQAFPSRDVTVLRIRRVVATSVPVELVFRLSQKFQNITEPPQLRCLPRWTIFEPLRCHPYLKPWRRFVARGDDVRIDMVGVLAPPGKPVEIEHVEGAG